MLALILSIIFFTNVSTNTIEAPTSSSISITSSEERVIQEVCEEDMPCWDCEAMGNGECGGDESLSQISDTYEESPKVVSDGPTLTFMGYTSTDQTNNRDTWSVQSEIDPTIWYTYTNLWAS